MRLVWNYIENCCAVNRPRGQTSLETKILASASSIWPRLGLGLVNLVSKKMCYPMQNNIILYPFRGCIIATVITKTWLSTLMWDTNSLTCSWHCHHVFLFMWPWPRPRGPGLDLHLGLDVLAPFNTTGELIQFLPHLWQTNSVLCFNSLSIWIAHIQSRSSINRHRMAIWFLKPKLNQLTTPKHLACTACRLKFTPNTIKVNTLRYTYLQ